MSTEYAADPLHKILKTEYHLSFYCKNSEFYEEFYGVYMKHLLYGKLLKIKVLYLYIDECKDRFNQICGRNKKCS